MFCWVLNLCAGVIAAMAEAKAENEVDVVVGWSCCSSYSKRLLCLRLCHLGIFQVRICHVLSCGDVALLFASSTSLSPSCTCPPPGSLIPRCCQQRYHIFVCVDLGLTRLC